MSVIEGAGRLRCPLVAFTCGVGMLCAVAGVTASDVPRPAVASPVVAKIGEASVTEFEVDAWWRRHDERSYDEAREQIYEGRRRALDGLIAEHVLAAEAARAGLSVEALLARELPRRATPVQDTEIDEVITRARSAAGSRTEVRPVIVALLERQHLQQAREAYERELAADPRHGISVLLEAPRREVAAGSGRPRLGLESAPVEIVEFADFECPYCQRLEGALRRLVEQHGGEVSLVWRHFPLSGHPHAREAAEAAACAHEQQRFWPYHARLFAAQDRLQTSALRDRARDLGLDEERFAECTAARRYAGVVDEDIEAARQYGVDATPTVFIGGRVVVGAQDAGVYERMVVEELARVRRRQ